MPGFNKQGPEGKGALTGGRRGLCNQEPQNVDPETTDNTVTKETNMANQRGGAGCRRRGGSGRGMGMGGGRRQR